MFHYFSDMLLFVTQTSGSILSLRISAFMEQLKKNTGSTEDPSSIIGQFGVGFYSSFMVADKVEVFTRSSLKDSPGYRWSSDGTGTYEIQEAEGVQPGTKIALLLKQESREFSDEDTVSAPLANGCQRCDSLNA
ncbi:heat shock protein 75 kDa, mitochondrial-like [Zootermopsis nevadensis]|uniref:heat shock protein 75 kDa, mitochondrial-like n=1 Tax=Zootermopsis nevadensis TaxID=136037 RepID=UPI000B8EB531|nr:heat shock protein 75 kDa, mitochondrial-like [Zootermopsis nevadensis]